MMQKSGVESHKDKYRAMDKEKKKSILMVRKQYSVNVRSEKGLAVGWIHGWCHCQMRTRDDDEEGLDG